jgi:hypothetical protein
VCARYRGNDDDNGLVHESVSESGRVADLRAGEGSENGEEEPQTSCFPSDKLHAPKLTHVFLKLHELHLTLVPLSQKLRTTQLM